LNRKVFGGITIAVGGNQMSYPHIGLFE